MTDGICLSFPKVPDRIFSFDPQQKNLYHIYSNYPLLDKPLNAGKYDAFRRKETRSNLPNQTFTLSENPLEVLKPVYLHSWFRNKR